MSKLDQMRRQREEQYARQQQQTSGGVVSPKVTPVKVVAAEKTKATSDAEEGKCSVCGKLKALANGLVANHQKGLGKMCPGSRKEPA